MKMNRCSLFFKIFMGIWGGTIMVFALTPPILIILLSSQESRDAFYDQCKKGLDKKLVLDIKAAAAKNTPQAILREAEKAEKYLNSEIYIFDKDNNELRNKTAPPADAQEIIDTMTDDKIILIKKS